MVNVNDLTTFAILCQLGRPFSCCTIDFFYVFTIYLPNYTHSYLWES